MAHVGPGGVEAGSPFPRWAGTRVQGTAANSSGLVQCGQGCPGEALGEVESCRMDRASGSKALPRGVMLKVHVSWSLLEAGSTHMVGSWLHLPRAPPPPKSASFTGFQAPPPHLELGALGAVTPELPPCSDLVGLGNGQRFVITIRPASFPAPIPPAYLTAG